MLLLTSFFKFCLFKKTGCKDVFWKTAKNRLFARNLRFSIANILQILSLKGVKHPGRMKFNLSSFESGLIPYTDKNKTEKQRSLVSLFFCKLVTIQYVTHLNSHNRHNRIFIVIVNAICITIAIQKIFHEVEELIRKCFMEYLFLIFDDIIFLCLRVKFVFSS